MKDLKYKLIKELPFENSPKVGYISEPKPGANDSHYWNHNWFKPEDYPEFWQPLCPTCNRPLKEGEDISYKEDCKCEVVKDYTVLSWLNRHNKFVGRYSSSIRYRIHSVRRNSDMEVFTLDDKIKYYNSIGIIDSFYFNEHNQLSFKIKGVNSPCTGVFPSKYLEKVKNPLATTEDGVDIYEGDSYYFVDKKSYYISTIIKKADKYSGIARGNVHRVYFSSLEKAEEYVFNNKPVLSLNDINNSLKPSSSFREIRERLEKLVKSKL